MAREGGSGSRPDGPGMGKDWRTEGERRQRRDHRRDEQWTASLAAQLLGMPSTEADGSSGTLAAVPDLAACSPGAAAAGPTHLLLLQNAVNVHVHVRLRACK